jgi:hypothetical protein
VWRVLPLEGSFSKSKVIARNKGLKWTNGRWKEGSQGHFIMLAVARLYSGKW